MFAVRSRCTSACRRLFASSAEQLILCDINASTGVATVTFNVPSKLNPMTVEMGVQFSSIVNNLRQNDSVRAVVLTGAGRAFSAGGELHFLLDRTRDQPINNSTMMFQFYSRFLALRHLPVPIIAAINGPAIGAGLCVASACDIRVTAAPVKLGYTFATLALHPGMAATYFLPKLVGQETAARLLLTGEVFNGTRAKEMGLVSELCQTEAEVLPCALQLATSIAAHSKPMIRSCVRSLRLGLDEGLERALQREADSQAVCFASPEFAARLQELVAEKDRAAKK
jgi:enoyl-CoA hydratase/carnithine racemase